jgi:hypothetical protein
MVEGGVHHANLFILVTRVMTNGAGDTPSFRCNKLTEADRWCRSVPLNGDKLGAAGCLGVVPGFA